MQKIIKLIEVREEPSSYCPVAQRCKTSFSQSPLFINTDHIAMMREEHTVAPRLTDCIDNGGLVPEKGFTRMSLNSGNSATSLVVVGNPEQIMETLRGNDGA